MVRDITIDLEAKKIAYTNGCGEDIVETYDSLEIGLIDDVAIVEPIVDGKVSNNILTRSITIANNETNAIAIINKDIIGFRDGYTHRGLTTICTITKGLCVSNVADGHMTRLMCLSTVRVGTW